MSDQQQQDQGLLARIARTEGAQNEIIETLQAITAVIGQGEVQARLGAIKRDKMKQIVDEAVKQGQLTTADEVEENSFIVGHQKDAQGNVLFPGRFQVFASEVLENVRKLLVGKVSGEDVTLEDGGVVTIDEIYGPPPETKAAEPAPKAPKKTKPPKGSVVKSVTPVRTVSAVPVPGSQN
jgi:hypothetical protein